MRREHGRQASNQVTVGNCVTSLRLLSNLDWPVFLEKTSVVESLLRGDPARVYATMDFASRDEYRHVVEGVARYGRLTESQVAQAAVDLAAATSAAGRRAAATSAAGASERWPAAGAGVS